MADEKKAKPKPMWVIATQRGQGPDMRWRDVGAPAFRIMSDQFSKTWMKEVSEEESEKLEEQRKRDEMAKAAPEKAALLEALNENEALKAEVEALKAELEKAQKPPAPKAEPKAKPDPEPPEKTVLSEQAK